MFNSKLRENALNNYNTSVKRYEGTAEKLGRNTDKLYGERKKALSLVKLVEKQINELSNSPKEFNLKFKKIEIEVDNFKIKQQKIKKAEIEAKAAAGGSGAGATLSALGVAVATMGPTAAMGVATTFGVASTGTAISTLSGAAATNAALACIGGGTLAAGGGGISAGSAFLGLAGPIGWATAGVMLTVSMGSGLFASHKNKDTAQKLMTDRKKVEKTIRKFNNMNAEVEALTKSTRAQIDGVSEAQKAVTGNDYSHFSKDEKLQAGLLVNSTLTLAQLVNKEIKLNDY